MKPNKSFDAALQYCTTTYHTIFKEIVHYFCDIQIVCSSSVQFIMQVGFVKLHTTCICIISVSNQF